MSEGRNSATGTIESDSTEDSHSVDSGSVASGSSGRRGRRQKFDIRKHGLFHSKLEQALFTTSFGMSIYSLNAYSDENQENIATILQVFVVYLVIGIPTSYMQMVLGQYAHLSVFLLKRMVPIADGLGFSYGITIFFSSVLAIHRFALYILYLILAIVPGEHQWNLCGGRPNCWELQRSCKNPDGCISPTVFVSAYVFWNTTIQAGAPRIEDRYVAIPNVDRILVSFAIWLLIYIVSLVHLTKLKIFAEFHTIVHLLWKACIAFYFVFTAGPVKVFIIFTESSIRNIFNSTAWHNAVVRVVLTMTLGDFSHVMIGSLSGDKVKTGTVSFLIGMLSFFSVLLTDTMINSSMLLICELVNIPEQKKYLIFRPTNAPTGLISLPTIFELLPWSAFFNIVQLTLVATAILMQVILNVGFLLEAVSQRITIFGQYKKYITPIVCFSAWFGGIILQGPWAYEIRRNFEQVTIYFCQFVNVCMFALVVTYIYGVRRFCDDVHFLQRRPPNFYWKITWTLAPAFLIYNICWEYLSRSSIFFYERLIEISIMISPYVILGSYEIIKKIIERKTILLISAEKKWGPKELDRRAKRRLFNPRTQTRYIRGTLHCHHQCLINNKIISDLVTKENEVMSRLVGINTVEVNTARVDTASITS